MQNKFIKFWHYGLATVGGSGYVPFAPGTAGSLVAVLFFWFVPLSPGANLLLLVTLSVLGVFSATYVEKLEGEDPGKVVIDEFVGQGLTLLVASHTLCHFIAGFILFRIFDIFKPAPVRQAERLRAGLGIMADDLVAGIYSIICLQILIWMGAHYGIC